MERAGGISFFQRLSPHTRERLLAYLCISPWAVGFLVFVVGAMVMSLGLSLVETDLLTELEFVGLKNFGKLFTDGLTLKSVRNTAYYSFATVPLGTAFALVIALILNQDISGQSVFRTIYYLPSVVSGVAVAILWRWLYAPDYGPLNAALAQIGILGPRWIYSEEWAMPSFIIMSVWGTGGSMLIFLAGLQGIPTVLYEASEIDGANAWQRFWHITIPMLTPTIFFSVVMRIIGSWQVFTAAYVMTQGGPNNATLTMAYHLYRKGFEQFRFGYASAIAWLLFLIVLLFTLLVFRSSQFWVYYAGETGS